jgi:Dyp-type peroxidase family
MKPIETQDIQGLIIRAYSKLSEANYMLLRIEDAQAAKSWLGGIVARISNGEKDEDTPFIINLALTFSGLQKLGLPASVLDTFPRELQEGMHSPHRQAMLGDYGDSAPEKWDWGSGEKEVDILLVLIASSVENLQQLVERERAQWEAGGLAVVKRIEATSLSVQREHFGFGGVSSQPFIEGFSKKGNPDNTIKTGEVLMGYLNEYRKRPDSPLVRAELDPLHVLPDSLTTGTNGNGSLRDLGKNGSYLVFRQLKQEVKKFWEFIDEKSRRADNTSDPEARLLLAAKMVGRWPDGSSLVRAPNKHDDKYREDDDFLYAETDRYGEKCPIGAHIRRTNPRDTKGDNPRQALKVNNRHRILRRGRSYGPPLAPSMRPEDMLQAEEVPGIERGINFICFNTSINRQFEFIQQTWINNPKFDGLYDQSDPLLGKPDPHHQGLNRHFSMPGCPVRKRVTNLPSFVETRGGAYFFMPGIKALSYMASLS